MTRSNVANATTVSIDQHRSAIEALSEIDRLLLRSSELEAILDSVMPSISAVLHCASVSVFLIDYDSRTHARAYDYFANDPATRPVRRIGADLATVTDACGQTLCWWATAADAATATFLEPLCASGARSFHLCSLHHDNQVAGLLCVGYEQPRSRLTVEGLGISEFADRLSVVLANHDRSEQLYREANFDSLTDLPNRRLFSDRLSREISRCIETGEDGALLYLDLDHFKHINDTEGHSAGDTVLRLVARRIAHCLKDTDTLGRLGGDEFAIFLPRIADLDAPLRTAELILERVRRPVTINGREHLIGASVGVTRVPADGRSVETLLKSSDIAMYRAKESGRGCAVVYAEDMQERMTLRMRIEIALRHAVQHQEFSLVYQPIVHCASGRIRGIEALLRWPDGPEGVRNKPATFVQIAEESNLIIGLGTWVFNQACREFADMRGRGFPLDYLSVNMSVRQLREATLCDELLATLARCGLEPGQLQVEITEGVLADGAATERTLRRLSAAGMRLALDDFGTGYSSLSYLRNFPICTVKVDRTFIGDVPGDRRACRLIESIVDMCKALDKQIVAEGAETPAQLEFLASIGCDAVQGFHTGRPMTAAALRGYVLDRQPASDAVA